MDMLLNSVLICGAVAVISLIVGFISGLWTGYREGYPDYDRFHNALRIMIGIDRDELLQAGIQLDDSEWCSFKNDPYRWFFMTSDQRAHEFWALIEARQTKKAG